MESSSRRTAVVAGLAAALLAAASDGARCADPYAEPLIEGTVNARTDPRFQGRLRIGTPLPPIVLRDYAGSQVSIPRTAYELTPGVSIVALHKQVPLGRRRYLPLEDEFLGFTYEKELNTRVVYGHEDPWGDERYQYSFNCHAFALGPFAGLGPSDWIEGLPSNIEPILNGYFNLVASYRRGQNSQFLGNKDMLAGDVIVLRDGENYEHSAKLVPSESRNPGSDPWWVVNKWGDEPLMRLPLRRMIILYEGHFSQILVYRPKS